MPPTCASLWEMMAGSMKSLPNSPYASRRHVCFAPVGTLVCLYALLVCIPPVLCFSITGKNAFSQNICRPRRTHNHLNSRVPQWETATKCSRSKSNVHRHHRPLTCPSSEITLRATSSPSSSSSSKTHRKSPPAPDKEKVNFGNMGQVVVKLYTDYASRLWRETSTDARRRIANEKAISDIEHMEHLVRGEEYFDIAAGDFEAANAKEAMLDACDSMLKVLKKRNATVSQSDYQMDTQDQPVPSHSSLTDSDTVAKDGESSLVKSEDSTALSKPVDKTPKARKKPRRSIMFGATMGAIVACWVFSGNYVFTGLFTLMTVLGQLEYYRMVMNAGIYPARRISVCGAAAMFITALFAPELHQICLPVFGTIAMVWFLTMRRTVTTISEIAATFTGMFYLGYIPSFWVRIRSIGGGREPTRLAPIVKPLLEMVGQKASRLPTFIPKSIHLPITTGAVFIFWSWLCIAFSDVGAYFTGRYFGRTKLGTISPAAGATSPNKTVEGVIGGCAVSACLGALGAWVQKWPYWYLTGSLHGIYLAIFGLIGDLTASMLKRDAGLKDFGDLIPEHGGVMDRVDSFIFTAPYSWLVISYIIPALKSLAKSR